MLTVCICAGLALLMSALPFVFGTVYFMVADDYLINYIANGSYGFTFSDRLTFLRMPAGVLLKLLYGQTTAVNWYLVLLLGVLVLSFAAVHLVVLKRMGSVPALLVSCAVNYLVVAHFLSFTVAAFLAALAGAGLLVHAAAEGKHVGRCAFLAAAFAFVSWCLRRNALYEAALLMLPLAVLSVVRLMRRGTGEERSFAGALKGLSPLALPLLVFCIAAGASAIYEKKAYSSPAWTAFQAYDEARSLAVDYPAADYDEVKKELKKIGVTRLDGNLLQSWRYAEKSFFTEELLRGYAAVNRAGITMKNRMDALKSALHVRMLPFLIAPLLIFLLLVITGRAKHLPVSLLTLLFGYGLLFVFAFIRMRFVMRVVLPTQLITCYALVFAADAGERTNKVFFADLFAAVLLLLISMQYLGYYEDINPVSRTYCEEEPAAALTREMAAHPDTLYVLDSSVLSHQFYFGTPASQVKTTDRFRNVVRSGSWDSYSPRYYEQVAPFLENPDDLLTAIVEEENVAYVSGGGAEEILAFYKERTGRTATQDGQAFPGSGVTIWRCRGGQVKVDVS